MQHAFDCSRWARLMERWTVLKCAATAPPPVADLQCSCSGEPSTHPRLPGRSPPTTLNQFHAVPGHLFFFKSLIDVSSQLIAFYLSTRPSHTLVSLFLRVYQLRHSCSSFIRLFCTSYFPDSTSDLVQIDCFQSFLWNICTHHHHGPCHSGYTYSHPI